MLDGDKVMIYAIAPGSELLPLDSCIVENGTFHMNGVAPIDPSNVLLSVVDKHTGENSGVDRMFILEAGNIRIDIDSSLISTVTGTNINDMYNTCTLAMIVYQDSCDALADTDMPADQRRNIYFKLRKNRNTEMINAMLPNIDYNATQDIIRERYTIFSKDELAQIAASLDSKHSKSAQNYRTKTRESVIGSTIDEVVIPSPDSTMVRMQDVFSQHDYTLIDFWASWCGPCMRNMIALKQLYQKYQGPRFEVIGVSLDDNKSKWLKAIDQVDGGWTDVSYLTGWSCDLATRLNIDYVPATILVDRKGVIVARDPSYSELEIILAL